MLWTCLHIRSIAEHLSVSLWMPGSALRWYTCMYKWLVKPHHDRVFHVSQSLDLDHPRILLHKAWISTLHNTYEDFFAQSTSPQYPHARTLCKYNYTSLQCSQSPYLGSRLRFWKDLGIHNVACHAHGKASQFGSLYNIFCLGWMACANLTSVCMTQLL